MSFYSSLIRKVFDSADGDFIKSLQSLGFRGSSFRGLFTGFISLDRRADSSVWSLVVSYKESDGAVSVSLSRESYPTGLDSTLGEWEHQADATVLESLDVARSSLEAFMVSKGYAGLYDALESTFAGWKVIASLDFRPLLSSEAKKGQEVYLIGDVGSTGGSRGERGRLMSSVDGHGDVMVSFEGKAPVVCSYNDLYVRFAGDRLVRDSVESSGVSAVSVEEAIAYLSRRMPSTEFRPRSNEFFYEDTELRGIKTPAGSVIFVSFGGYADIVDGTRYVSSLQLIVFWYAGKGSVLLDLGASEVLDPKMSDLKTFYAAYKSLLSATTLAGARDIFQSVLRPYITVPWDVNPVWEYEDGETYLYYNSEARFTGDGGSFKEVRMVQSPAKAGDAAVVAMGDGRSVRVNSFALYKSV